MRLLGTFTLVAVTLLAYGLIADMSNNFAEVASPPPPAPEPAAVPPAPEPEPEFLSVEKVQRMMPPGIGCGAPYDIGCFSHSIDSMVALGESAFPAYEAILTDPKSESWHRVCVHVALSRLKTDRRRFVPLALQQLSDAKVNVRNNAVLLLGQIGDERDAAPVVPLLSDGDGHVRYSAAITLSKIGGKHHLDALDACLKADDPRRDANELQHLKKCRDELEARVKANPIPKHITN